MIFSYFKYKFIIFVLEVNTWQFNYSNSQGVGPVCTNSVSFVYTELLVWALLQSDKLNLTYCLKSVLLLPFCFQFVCMVYQTRMCPLSFSPLRLFWGIICNIHSVNPLIHRRSRFSKNHRREIWKRREAFFFISIVWSLRQ